MQRVRSGVRVARARARAGARAGQNMAGQRFAFVRSASRRLLGALIQTYHCVAIRRRYALL
eukprot:5257789-Lingulodinium_polyedra.AAC.1